MKRLLLPPVVVLGGFLAFVGLFRLSSGGEKPTKTPPPMPTVEEIHAKARSVRYEIGKYGGTLNDWITGELKDLNLAISSDATTSNVLGGLVFERLFDSDPFTLDYRPLLATEVPSHSEDAEGRVYIVKLRKDVQFHDGHPMNADDVVFSYNEIVLNEAIACRARPQLQMEVPDENGKIVKRNLLVEKIDDYTVRFTLPQRYALFLTVINGSYIFPKHLLKSRVDDGTFNSTWNIATPPSQVVGTGPYMPAEYVSGERFVEKRNPNYYKKDEAGNRLPYVDSIVYNIIQSADIQKARFLSGQLDYMEARAIDLKELLPKQERGNFEVFIGAPIAAWSYMAFNQNPRSRPDGTPYVKPWKSKWFRDVRFRRAMAHCIDKDSIKQLVYDGIASPNWVPYTPKFTKYWTSDVRQYALNIEEANRLLDDMGLTKRDSEGYRTDEEGHRVEFVLNTYANQPTLVQMVTIVEQDMKKAGVRLIPDYLEFNLLVRKGRVDWDWECMLMSFTAGPEPLLGKIIWKSTEERNWNPRVPPGSPDERDWEKRIDAIYEEAYTHWDEKEKRFQTEKDVELAHEWQRLAAENLPHIYLLFRPEIHAISLRIRNRVSTAHQLMDQTRIYFDK